MTDEELTADLLSRKNQALHLLRNFDLHAERVEMEVERLGPRKPTTVGQLMDAIAELPRDMPVKVGFNPNWKPIGTSDPYYAVHKVAAEVGLSSRNTPMLGDTGVKWFVVE